MKYLKKFNESKSNDIVEEILSNKGWDKIDPPSNEHWNIELRYHLKDDIFIDVLNFKSTYPDEPETPETHFPYFLRKDKIQYYINSYRSNYTNLFSEYTIYRDLSDYDRMMKICNYLMPYFDRKPSDDLIEDIKDCFVDISDKLSVDPTIEWGYCDVSKEEYCYFPAYRFIDQLCLCLFYEHNKDIDFVELEEEFNNSKERLKSWNIHPNNAEIIFDHRVIIKIRF